MGKEVYIIRHAKASWDHGFELTDINRPLETRGVKDAILMGQSLKNAGVRFDGIFASNGIRALHTACIMAGEMGLPTASIQIQEALYHPHPKDLLNAIQQANNELQCIALFAHNPGIEDFAYQLNRTIDRVATNGIIHIKTTSATWSEVTMDSLEFQSYDTPRKHR